MRVYSHSDLGKKIKIPVSQKYNLVQMLKLQYVVKKRTFENNQNKAIMSRVETSESVFSIHRTKKNVFLFS